MGGGQAEASRGREKTERIIAGVAGPGLVYEGHRDGQGAPG